MPDQAKQATLFGHPAGLYTLFFAEMWERFSFYGMKALLFFYMTKSFLRYGDGQAYAVLGAYTALVYMTPFFGGMIADRLLGARRAIVLGGLLMAAGHSIMGVKHDVAFFTALALLIAGNGFFKPNISTIVGSLYAEGSVKRDAGFTIFYMGVNLGAAVAPLLCGYIGETIDWHLGFGLATIGMLTGLAVFVAPTRVTQVVIMAGALAGAYGLVSYHPDDPFSIAVNVLVGICLVAAGIIAWMALGRGGLPEAAGQPRDREYLRQPVLGPMSREWLVYAGTLLSVPVFALLVSGFAPLTINKHAVSLVPESVINQMESSDSGLLHVAAVFLKEISKPAGLVLILSGLAAAVYLGLKTSRMENAVTRQRMYAVFVLTFFSVLFWSFFEQTASSVNSFTDRNVDRVSEATHVSQADVGKTIRFRVPQSTNDQELKDLPLLSQQQFGYRYGSSVTTDQIVAAIRNPENTKGKTAEEVDEVVETARKSNLFTMTALTYLREAARSETAQPQDNVIDWLVTKENVGMAVGGAEAPATVFQSVNSIYILLFGVALSAFWGFLGARGLEPSTPLKFALALLQLGLGFVAFWYGAMSADDRGMVALFWLLLGYLLLTTGELCLSPVGLAMITRLSPARLVSTVMGAWFLATAFSEFLAAIIAQFTGVAHGAGGEGNIIPAPVDTVNVYGHVFGIVAITAMGASVVCFALVPLLKRWMHEDVVIQNDQSEPSATVEPAVTP